VKRKKSTKNPPTPKKYSDFIGKISLQGVGLDSATAKVDRNSLAKPLPKGETLAVNLDAKFGVLHLSDESLVASATFKLIQTNKEIEDPILLIECSFSALFNLGVPADDETAQRFANTEAKLVFWPYLRHFIADTSYRMAINPVLLPLITATGGDSEKS
jgi:hypothetical protein